MEIKCAYCGNFIEESDEKCPYCGAANEGIKRTAGGTPHTIEELKAFALEKNIPLDKFCFYIGENYKGPKAFGIYKDENTGKFVVYKNKSDGSRAIRYEGNDEAYAVNEIYQKLKEQVTDYKNFRLQKGKSANAPSNNHNQGKGSSPFPTLIKIGGVILLIFIVFCLFSDSGSSGNYSYYSYNGDEYRYDTYSDIWYLYDTVDSTYQETTPPTQLVENSDDYYEYSEEYTKQTTDSDWDSDDDYDWSFDSNDSWDSDWSTDWDSDW